MNFGRQVKPELLAFGHSLGQAWGMDAVATAVAEDILRRIYGDDLHGCKVSLDEIAAVVEAGLKMSRERQELIEMYEKAIEAVSLLATPPQTQEMPTPEELRTMLGERLDAIQKLARKVMETTARVQKPVDGGG